MDYHCLCYQSRLLTQCYVSREPGLGPLHYSHASGSFREDSTYCYMADNEGHGSISETGSYFYPPYAVLVESYANSVSKGNQIAFGITFIEADPNRYQDGYLAVFSGTTGTLTGDGKMAGSWVCSYGDCTVPNPQGGSGTLGGNFAGNN